MVGFIKLTCKAPNPPKGVDHTVAGKPKSRPFSLGRTPAVASIQSPSPRVPSEAAASEALPLPTKEASRQDQRAGSPLPKAVSSKTAVGKRLSSHISRSPPPSANLPSQENEAWQPNKSGKPDHAAEIKRLHKPPQQQVARTPDSQHPPLTTVGLLKVDVVGCRHYQSAVSCPRSQGQEVLLVRESENPHDQNAVRVLMANAQVGHVPKEVAAWLSKLLDSGAVTALGFVASSAPQNSGATTIPLVVKILSCCGTRGPGEASDIGTEISFPELQAAWTSLRERIDSDVKKLSWRPPSPSITPTVPTLSSSPRHHSAPIGITASPLSSNPPPTLQKPTQDRIRSLSFSHGTGMPEPMHPYPQGLLTLSEVNYRVLLAKASYKPLMLPRIPTTVDCSLGMIRYPVQQILKLSDTEVSSLNPSSVTLLLLRECSEADDEADSEFELLLAMDSSLSGRLHAHPSGSLHIAAPTTSTEAVAGESIESTVTSSPSSKNHRLNCCAEDLARTARAKLAHGMEIMSLVCRMGGQGTEKGAGWDFSQLHTEAVDAEWFLPPCISRDRTDKIVRSA